MTVSWSAERVMEWLRAEASEEHREGLLRYGIPNERALGVPMGAMKRCARRIGRSHALATELWDTGVYEARTMAAFLDEPDVVGPDRMDRWAADFDSWAICDTVCFHLFDRTVHAWSKSEEWAPRTEEFVRRAAYALVWALSVHDKRAADDPFEAALHRIGSAEADERPLVKKAMNMALRAVGKRNRALNGVACGVAEELAGLNDPHRAWIGSHALRELTSEKVRARL